MRERFPSRRPTANNTRDSAVYLTPGESHRLREIDCIIANNRSFIENARRQIDDVLREERDILRLARRLSR
jgi:hypothetical protein